MTLNKLCIVGTAIALVLAFGVTALAGTKKTVKNYKLEQSRTVVTTGSVTVHIVVKHPDRAYKDLATKDAAVELVNTAIGEFNTDSKNQFITSSGYNCKGKIKDANTNPIVTDYSCTFRAADRATSARAKFRINYVNPLS